MGGDGTKGGEEAVLVPGCLTFVDNLMSTLSYNPEPMQGQNGGEMILSDTDREGKG